MCSSTPDMVFDDDRHLLSVKDEDSKSKIEAFEAYIKYLSKFNATWCEDPGSYTPVITSSNEEHIKAQYNEQICSKFEKESNDCLPNRTMKIIEHEDMGRYYVAARPIKAGEVVLIEPPYVVGPMGCSSQCLKCLSPIKGHFSCAECGFYFCDSNCLTGEHQLECSDLKGFGLSETEFKSQKDKHAKLLADQHHSGKEDEKSSKLRKFLARATEALQSRHASVILKNVAITTLRTLREMEQHPEKCATIMAMAANVVEDSIYFKKHQTSLVNPIREKIRPTIDSALLQRIAAVWDTNCFEVALGPPGNRVQGMYPAASLINHACKANIQQYYGARGAMILRAVEDIIEGEEFTIWYMNPLWPTRIRRAHLCETKHFDCCCDRCSDPTELGTFIGSPLCSSCKAALVPIDPLDYEADWVCTKEGCENVISYFQVKAMDARLAPMLLKVTGKDLDVMRDVVEGLEENLHPNNHLILRMYLTTILYHSKMDIHDYSENHLELLCKAATTLVSVLMKIESSFAVKTARINREFVRYKMELLQRKKMADKNFDLTDDLQKLEEIISRVSVCMKWNGQTTSMDEINQVFKNLKNGI